MAHPHTIEKRQKIAEKFARSLACQYPAVFDFDRPKPLKIGIREDLYDACPDVSRRGIQRFLRWWTSREEYATVRAQAEQGMSPRYDLQGVPHAGQ